MAGFNGWAVALLRAAGLPITKANLNNLALWQRAEGGSAAFNPLNTTQPATGATAYNSNGGNPVKNYTSANQGVRATAQTLENGHYGNILALLKRGNATPQEFGSAVAASPWGTGSGILREIGKGPVSLPQVAGLAGGGSKGMAVPGIGANPQQQLAMMLLAQSQQSALGNLDSGGALSMALARQSSATASAGAPQGTFSAATPNVSMKGAKAGGFLPGSAAYKAGRLDQGHDFQTNPGGPIIAPGDGVVMRVASDPHGFGPAYPIVHFTSGPYAGKSIYIGHTLSALQPGQRFAAGQVISRTGTHPVGNAGVPGWAEIGYAPGNVPGSFGQGAPF